MLGQIDNTNTLVADFEAGLGTLSRVEPSNVDVFVVVAEPTVKSLEVAQRALRMISDGGLGRAIMVGNRIASAADEKMLRTIVTNERFVAVPDDAAIREADAKGVAPFDFAPDAPAVKILREIALSLADSNAM
ncbi:MAG: hypothetical protein M3Z07_04905 [Candidatus Eremiobacteraeota bacterium]|nr:hypothetical protein [Candidatus Eremiobacteraeota bacterium]